MRFEIKAGGAFLIVIGLLGLSLIVFALGLFAGYDMARNTVPEAPQAASVYPLPNPPPSAEAARASTKSSDKSSDEIASTQPAPKPIVKAKAPSSGDSGASSLSMDKNAGPVTTPPPRTIASAPAPPPKVSPPEAAPDVTAHFTKPEVTNPAEKYTSDGDISGGHHGKPFNIQIDAVMDRSNAEQMTTRLQKLGYHAFMVPTDISGQTWWRVRVGPYQSQDEASAAEQELRAKYKDTYSP